MKLPLLIAFLSFFLSVSAQHDTVFFDIRKEKCAVKDFEGTYCFIEKHDDLYVAKRYLSPNGVLEAEETYKDSALSVLHGPLTKYFESGKTKSIEFYVNDTLNGLNKYFYETGELYFTWEVYDKGFNRNFKVYYPDGKLKREEVSKMSIQISATCYSPKGKKIKYFEWQTPAIFPGGREKMVNYMTNQIRQPAKMDTIKTKVKVKIKFCVGTDGSIRKVYVGESSGIPEWDQAALELVEKMPKWEISLRDNLPVECWMTLPVVFSPDTK